MQAAVINILINLQRKQLGNYDNVKICFPLPLHSTGTDRAFKFLNMPFMFSRALKTLWTVSLLGDAPSSPIPTGRLAILFIQWQEVFFWVEESPSLLFVFFFFSNSDLTTQGFIFCYQILHLICLHLAFSVCSYLFMFFLRLWKINKVKCFKFFL